MSQNHRSSDHTGHDHGAHEHSHTDGVSESRIGIAALLTGTFMIVELTGGLLSGSLALLADAGHMVTDFASLALAWYGFRLARRPADWRRTYGYERFTVLAAFANGLALFAVAFWIVIEAWHRLQSPTEVLGGLMLWVAIAGLAVNVIAFYVLQGGDQSNLNMRAALLHVAGDMLGSVAAIIAAVVIMTTGWMPIDAILSVLVSLIILRSAWYVIKDSGHILLEGAPSDFDGQTVAADLTASISGVDDVHHVHAWSINEKRTMITLHARLSDRDQADATVVSIKERLKAAFGFDHATVEVEFERCSDDAATAHEH